MAPTRYDVTIRDERGAIRAFVVEADDSAEALRLSADKGEVVGLWQQGAGACRATQALTWDRVDRAGKALLLLSVVVGVLGLSGVVLALAWPITAKSAATVGIMLAVSAVLFVLMQLNMRSYLRRGSGAPVERVPKWFTELQPGQRPSVGVLVLFALILCGMFAAGFSKLVTTGGVWGLVCAGVTAVFVAHYLWKGAMQGARTSL